MSGLGDLVTITNLPNSPLQNWKEDMKKDSCHTGGENYFSTHQSCSLTSVLREQHLPRQLTAGIKAQIHNLEAKTQALYH